MEQDPTRLSHCMSHIPHPEPPHLLVQVIAGKSQAAVGPARAKAAAQKFPYQKELTLGVYQEASHLMELRGYCVSKAKSFT